MQRTQYKQKLQEAQQALQKQKEEYEAKLQELQQQADEGQLARAPLRPADDPYWDPLPAECYLGSGELYLKPLASQIENAAKVKLFDSESKHVGELEVGVYPVTAEGKELADDDIKETPQELVGTTMPVNPKP
ncbi:uncharacterized protein EMH_0082670 [Eimeria mitis]|uniref:Uncharacterized protein n=1 Tax=Eimeria mitis TaxID=44415 RepID=U6K636_9EIME|nr:uncharacterized protein EMH_0082670 [Eimeria mitis]CDJ33455.1 hypothetical protein EMH_0082670 [Eimeria mitis]